MNDRSRGPRRPARSRTAPAHRRRRGDPARRAAYDLLRAVDEGAYANLELPQLLRRHRLSGRDAAFATELAYGTLRMRGLYDAVVEIAAGRPTGRIDPPVLDVLRLGVHQVLGMRVPIHAAADETVALAREVTGVGASGLVNAVLHRVGERDRDAWVAAVVGEREGSPRLALVQSHPTWIVTALRQALLGHGAATKADADAVLESLLAADNDPARVDLVARPGLATIAELVAAGAQPSTLSRVGAVLPTGAPGEIAAVRERRAAVQDVGSQLLTLALVDVPLAEGVPEGTWLDLCAGPGGKAGLLGALATERGADLVANEIAPHRADLVRSTLEPLTAHAAARGRRIEVRTGDGREFGAQEAGRYSRVLVDAPCTGLGALRRRPEARWRRSPDDVVALAPLQRELLRSALDAVVPGGVVAYATCSPHLQETTFVVRDVLKRRDDVEQLDARAFLRDAAGEPVAATGSGPAAQLWPHVHGTDGMFVALLRRRA